MSKFLCHPKGDGVTHINMYSKGRTELGRLLTNFAHTPFNMRLYGDFASMEAFWYWLKFTIVGMPAWKADPIREMHGLKAKEYGKAFQIRQLTAQEMESFKFLIRQGFKDKISCNPKLTLLLRQSTLPLAHYYWWGDLDNANVKLLPEYDWMTQEWEEIRKRLKGE